MPDGIVSSPIFSQTAEAIARVEHQQKIILQRAAEEMKVKTAIATARARARAERENEDVHLRKLRAESEQRKRRNLEGRRCFESSSGKSRF